MWYRLFHISIANQFTAKSQNTNERIILFKLDEKEIKQISKVMKLEL